MAPLHLRNLIALVLALAMCGCGRTLRSCAAHILILGPAMLSFECPPPGFHQQDNDATTNEDRR